MQGNDGRGRIITENAAAAYAIRRNSMSRKTARKHILNIVFQAEFDVDVEIEQIMAVYDEEFKTTEGVTDEKLDTEEKDIESKADKLRTIKKNDRKFIISEAKGVIENKRKLDDIIEPALEKWEIDRLSKVDLSILRIAVYEILFAEDIPNAVAANEAVQLAKLFSGGNAPKFINGVLGKVIKQVENEGQNI